MKKNCSLHKSETKVYKMWCIALGGVYDNAGKNTKYTRKTNG